MAGGSLEQFNRLLAFNKEGSEYEVFLAVGAAINQWNGVEELTCILFHRLMLGRAYALSASAFYALTAFSTRLTVMAETANWCLRYSGFEREFASIRNNLDKLSKRRNAIAHSICYTEFREGTFEGYLDRHAHDFKSYYREISQSRTFTLTTRDVKDFTIDTLHMQIWLHDFMLRWQPWHTWLSKSPAQHLDRVARYIRHPSESNQIPHFGGLSDISTREIVLAA